MDSKGLSLCSRREMTAATRYHERAIRAEARAERLEGLLREYLTGQYGGHAEFMGRVQAALSDHAEGEQL